MAEDGQYGPDHDFDAVDDDSDETPQGDDDDHSSSEDDDILVDGVPMKR